MSIVGYNAMRPMFFLFLIDGVSKAFLALASLLLIRHLSVSEFAIFSIVFTVSMMAYQIVGGVVERLYISDYNNFIGEYGGSGLPLTGVIGLIVLVYAFSSVGFYYAALAFVLVMICAKYQVQRIKKQKEEKFFTYALIDMLRNLIWFVLIYINFEMVANFVGMDNVLYALGTFCILTVLSSLFLVLLSDKASLDVCSDDARLTKTLRSLKYFISRKDVVAYSIVGGVIPYFPFMVATLMRDESLIATYGAAMRYQAIFSMAIVAVNTVVIARFCNNKEVINNHAYLFYKILPFIMVFLTAGIGVIYFAIPYIDGGKYPGLQMSFAILAMCSAVSLVSTVAVNKLVAFNRYSEILKSLFSGLVLMIVLTPVLIFLDYQTGPLLSVLAGYFLITFLLIYNAGKEAGDENSIG